MLFVKNLFVYYLDLYTVTLWLVQELPLRFAAAASDHSSATIG